MAQIWCVLVLTLSSYDENSIKFVEGGIFRYGDVKLRLNIP